jgi:hypothetical protein
MDAYTGTYLSLDMANDSKENADEEDFNLHVEQIKAAGGPFLDFTNIGTTLVVNSLPQPAYPSIASTQLQPKNLKESQVRRYVDCVGPS